MTAPTLPGARDRVVVPGYPGEFEVVGPPQDMAHGPFWLGPLDMPTPYEVGLKAYSQSTTVEDGYGNSVTAWGDPVPLPVCGWQSPGSGDGSEPNMQGHDRVIEELELLLPGYRILLKKVEG